MPGRSASAGDNHLAPTRFRDDGALKASRPNLVEQQRLVDVPLVHLPPEKLRPSRVGLDKINASFM